MSGSGNGKCIFTQGTHPRGHCSCRLHLVTLGWAWTEHCPRGRVCFRGWGMETAGSRDRVMGQRGPCDRGQGNKCLGDGYRSQHSGILVTNVKGVQVRDCYCTLACVPTGSPGTSSQRVEPGVCCRTRLLGLRGQARGTGVVGSHLPTWQLSPGSALWHLSS